MGLRTLLAAVCCGMLLASSAQADDKKVCSDAYVQAQALRSTHKLIAARDQLLVCARTQCTWMTGDCVKWLSEVDAAMPSFVFEVKDGEGDDLSAVQVTMDGHPLATKLDGSAIEIDPGEHHFGFNAADGTAHTEKKIVAREGDKNRHVSVSLGSGQPPAPQAANPKEKEESPAAESSGGTQRTIGFVVGGIGIAGLVVGSVFGVMSLSGSPCDSTTKTCTSQADHDTLIAHETVANVGLSVGLVAVAIGGYLLLTAPGEASTKEPASTSISPWIGWGSAGLAGSFQ